MSTERLYSPPLDQLKKLGEPSNVPRRPKGDWGYVERLGLSAEHVPGLMRIGRQWLDWEWENDGVFPEEPELWAPIHAWRALGELRAVEAVGAFLELMTGLDETDDDWYMEEFPQMFALMGPGAEDALERYVVDSSHRDYPRSVAGSSLTRLAELWPECRAKAVAGVARALADYEKNDTSLNAFFVGHLLQLKAVEQAELIERAFAAGRVDDEVCGYWGDIREELGVEGLGLAPDRPPQPRRADYFRLDPPDHVDKQERIRQRKRRQKLKARQKQRQKARKKNRR